MSAAAGIRLGELLAALSLAIDLGLGLPTETMLRTALVGIWLADAAGLSSDDRAAVYYLALLRFVGCTTTSHGDAVLFGGDELAVGELMVTDDDAMPATVTRLVGGSHPPAEQQRLVGNFFAAAMGGAFAASHRQHCEAAAIVASRLELGPAVQQGLAHIYARWDGRGSNTPAAGEAISLPMRVVHLATLVAYLGRTEDAATLVAAVRHRASRQLDPRLAALFVASAGEMVRGLDAPDLLPLVLAADPMTVPMTGAQLDRGLEAMADFGDLKTPHMLGHSRRVAALAADAASRASLPQSDIDLVRRAGLVHDLGRVGVPEALWIKAGALSPAEQERIRLHSYLTERVFANLPPLVEIGRIGGGHHERLDGSGYHRGTFAVGQGAAMRLLAVANSWCALTEPRPHRQTLTAAEAARELSSGAKAGRFDSHAVDAVLAAAGAAPSRRRSAAIALSEREIEVLRLVASQHGNKAIARALGISPKTVERHVTHIYDKIGVTTRAGAALYATDQGLI